MSEYEHTPGPWEVEASHRTPRDSVMAANNQQIAVIGQSSIKKGSHKANAQLIAAAPELLAAIELLVAHFAYPRENENLVVMQNARKAIAKAKKQV